MFGVKHAWQMETLIILFTRQNISKILSLNWANNILWIVIKFNLASSSDVLSECQYYNKSCWPTVCSTILLIVTGTRAVPGPACLDYFELLSQKKQHCQY